MINIIKQMLNTRVKTLPTNKLCRIVSWNQSENNGVVEPIQLSVNQNETRVQLEPFEVFGAVKGEFYKRPLDSGSGTYVTENISYKAGDRVLVCFVDKDYANGIVVGRL